MVEWKIICGNVCKDDFLKALKQLIPFKSSRTDNIPANIMKDMAEQLSGPLSLLSNLSFQSGQFPTSENQQLPHQYINQGIKAIWITLEQFQC